MWRPIARAVSVETVDASYGSRFFVHVIGRERCTSPYSVATERISCRLAVYGNCHAVAAGLGFVGDIGTSPLSSSSLCTTTDRFFFL